MSLFEPIVLEKPITKPGRKRQYLLIIVTIVILMIIIGVSLFIFFPKEKVYTLNSFEYTKVKKGTLNDLLQLSGTIQFKKTETVISPHYGIIENIFVEDGEIAGENQVLAKLQSRDIEENLSSLRLQHSKLLLELNKLIDISEIQDQINSNQLIYLEEELQEEREELSYLQQLATNDVALKDVEEAMRRVKLAEKNISDFKLRTQQAKIEHIYNIEKVKTNIEELENAVENVERELSDCLIKAKIRGKIIIINKLEENQRVSAGEELFKIQDQSIPVLEVKVSENEIGKVKVGLESEIYISGKSYKGEVTFVGSVAEKMEDVFNAVIDTEISFLEFPPDLISGINAEVEIYLGVMEDILYLPRGPFLTTGDQLYVYKITGDKAAKKRVVFGEIDSINAVIYDGLEEGDYIIISSYNDFFSHEEIRVDIGEGNFINR